MSLGLRIADLRRKKGQSLQQVADAVGVSKAHIWELEKERTDNPSMALVTRLADNFSVTVSLLVGEDLDASDADMDIQRMFRQAKDLEPHERAIIDTMIKALIEERPHR